MERTSQPRRGMGRGLAAILGETSSQGIRELPVGQIDPNPNQPRKQLEPEALAALAASLKERGVLQPVLVRPRGSRYELIAGERRWRAAQAAGLERIPAIVREVEDGESLELALIENMAREDLNPVEAARACAFLVEEVGLTHEEVGRRVGKSRVAITNLLRLLELPDDVLDLLAEGRLTEGHGRALLAAPDHTTRRVLARAAVRERWSVRETERRARAADRPQLRKAAAAGGRYADLAGLLEEQTGAAVRIRERKGGGVTVELRFSDGAEAERFARRLAGGSR